MLILVDFFKVIVIICCLDQQKKLKLTTSNIIIYPNSNTYFQGKSPTVFLLEKYIAKIQLPNFVSAKINPKPHKIGFDFFRICNEYYFIRTSFFVEYWTRS